MRRLQMVAVFVLVFLAIGIVAEEKLDRLVVMGQGFSFGVKEPDGWQGDTENAKEIPANIVFYSKTQKWQNSNPIIYIQITDKSNEDLAGDIAADMKAWKERYPSIAFKDFSASHPKYSTAAKEFFVEGKFTEYVVFASPGKEKPLKFSAILNVQKREATEQELATLREVVNSLVLLAP